MTKYLPPNAHKIRIIAGKHRGRKIPVRDADGLRPTPNRARDKSCAGGIIRIIAGKHRGRKIPVRDADGLRPTPNRARDKSCAGGMIQ